ncbi:MAG TPA: hypothetical protein VD810_00570 [Methylophilaceae bacterium]|nr:hypothetical protein [Methylophilaceae bacterium]
MKASRKALSLVVGSAFAASISATAVNAAENPFAMQTLTSGYMVADAHDAKEGKCGTGKCGAEKKAKGDKAKEGSCGADKAKEGSCGDGKGKEGSCGADKAKEGSCHADK